MGQWGWEVEVGSQLLQAQHEALPETSCWVGALEVTAFHLTAPLCNLQPRHGPGKPQLTVLLSKEELCE